MTAKLCYISNISGKEYIKSFSYSSALACQSLGMEFHSVSNRSASTALQTASDEKEYGIHLHDLCIQRNPFHLKNIKAYRQLLSLIEREKFDIIHCNTPVGGILGRLAAKKYSIKVIYQAHGFHFYKGAPLLNWLLYYPIERIFSRWTDALITINKEDFEFAKTKFKLNKNGRVYYVPGVGIDLNAFDPDIEGVEGKREELGISKTDIILISAGELNKNKNNEVIIRAMAQLGAKNISYVICGKGPLESELKQLAKSLGTDDKVHFLGYRSDVKELLAMSDIFVMPSYREGLSRSIMEAMAMGRPCIVSDIRGNRDMITENKGGHLAAPADIGGFAAAISRLVESNEIRAEFGRYNKQKVKEFELSKVCGEISKIYSELRS